MHTNISMVIGRQFRCSHPPQASAVTEVYLKFPRDYLQEVSGQISEAS